jgi:hypothetical protein
MTDQLRPGPIPGGPVERTLDELFDRLSGSGGAGRRALAEAEDHLTEAAAAGRGDGLDAERAERDAVARFGSPARVAAELQRVHRGPAAWLRPAFVGCWIAGGVGLVTVGVSGLVSELLGRLYGAAFVAGDAPGVTYTDERCADYYEYVPTASSCADAAAQHHWGEVVTGRVAVGVLGVLALLLLWILRRGMLRGAAWTPPAIAVGLPLGALFAAVGVLFTGISVLQLSFHDTDMAGANLATGVVSIAAAAAIGSWLAIHNRTEPEAG